MPLSSAFAGKATQTSCAERSINFQISRTRKIYYIFLSKMPAKQQRLAENSSEFRESHSVHYRKFSCVIACS